ncbi:hypothetical protein AKO1_007824 [Acrasis kona]|uniref:RCC1-like domain-containing protein n=1 Tax=Acrasis kona TaxID=1008807 RepID=A0AAW2YPT6_9EUKA
MGITVVDVACGSSHTLFITNKRNLYSVGNSCSGQLGLGQTNTIKRVPIHLDFYKINGKVKKVSAGFDHTLILTTDGNIFACGSNSDGQLGLSAMEGTPWIQQVYLDFKIKDICCGGQHSIIVTEDDKVFACGWNSCEQLGVGDELDRETFSEITELSNLRYKIKQVACSYYDTFFVLENGDLYNCGNMMYDLCGEEQSYPVKSTSKILHHNVESVSAGHDCAFFKLKNTHDIYALGKIKSDKFIPLRRIKDLQEVLFHHEVVDFISCGYYHTFFVTNFSRALHMGRLFDDEDVGEHAITQWQHFTPYVFRAASGQNYTVFYTHVQVDKSEDVHSRMLSTCQSKIFTDILISTSK